MYVPGTKKRVGIYRMIRTCKFLEFTADDLAARNRKAQEMYDALQPERKVISQEAASNFFQRLMEDGIQRCALLTCTPIARSIFLPASSISYFLATAYANGESRQIAHV